MAKKKKTRKKLGRPSRGPRVSVTFRLPKDLSDDVDHLRARMRVALSRTAALERVIRKGLDRQDRILDEIIAG